MTNERAQYEADQLHISELEAANDRLQAKITQFAGMLLDYETKFDLIAENEAKRIIEFGDKILEDVKNKARIHAMPFGCFQLLKLSIQSIDIKQLYTNFKKP